MFYGSQVSYNEPSNREWALVVLTSSESKRLIAKAVAVLPEVKRALEKGLIVIARSTTTAFVAEELTKSKIEPKCHFAAGVIFDGELCAVPAGTRMWPIVLRYGKRVDTPPDDALKEFRELDVFIKGANAVDPEGNVGILAAGEEGGTIAGGVPRLTARGSHIVVPIGLEKLVSSVTNASRAASIYRFKYSTGLPVGLIPVPNALVVTEVEAFRLLFGVKAVHLASGGIGGSEGAVVVSLEGDTSQVAEAFSLVKSIKGEPAVGRPAARVNPPAAEFAYDARAQWEVQSESDRK